jgi:hypothetical protein
MLFELTNNQRALAAAMSDLSEAGYHAGWLGGLEYDLWRLMLAGGQHYGHHNVSEEELMRLRSLFERCGGWIVFDDQREEVFVSLKDWEKMFATHAAKVSPPKT